MHRVQDKLCNYVAPLGAVSAMSLRLLRGQDTRNSVSLLIRGKQTVIELISNTSSMSRKYLLCRIGNFLSSQRRRVFPVLLASRVQPGSVPLTRKRTQAIPSEEFLKIPAAARSRRKFRLAGAGDYTGKSIHDEW